MYVCVYIYIYIYTYVWQRRRRQRAANPQTKNLEFQGCASGRLLIWRGGVLRSTGEFPDI